MNQDLFNVIKITASLDPVAKTASFVSTGIAVAGYESATAYVYLGTAAANSLASGKKWVFTLEECATDTDGSYTTVATADIIGAAANSLTVDATTEDNLIYAIGYKGTLEYIRVRCAATGSPGSTPMAIFFALGNARHATTGQTAFA